MAVTRIPVTLSSGHILEVATPDLRQAKALYKAIARELLSVDLDLANVDLKKVTDLDPSVFVKAILQTMQSDAVEAAVWACATQSLLQGQPINGVTFEPEDMRQDYFPVAWEVTKRTLSPFFSFLGLQLSTLDASKATSQK